MREKERERDPELATRDSIQWLWMELFSPISSIIETVDLICTIPDDTLGSLPLSLAHNKQLYGYIYKYVYLLLLAQKYLDLSPN
jgi:hypothetical protein